jgi:hypothetical protein
MLFVIVGLSDRDARRGANHYSAGRSDIDAD